MVYLELFIALNIILMIGLIYLIHRYIIKVKRVEILGEEIYKLLNDETEFKKFMSRMKNIIDSKF